MENTFGKIVDTMYNLQLNDKLELKKLLEQNIGEERRLEIFGNFQTAKDELSKGELIFSSDISKLKKML